jgi:4-alpha-glucanotransferase
LSLRALAAHVGVLTEFTSYRGELIEVRADVLAAVLTACGVDTTLADDRAIADYDERTRATLPIVVAWDGVVPPETPGRNDLPSTLPFGYHRTGAALIISAPQQAVGVDRRRCGVYAPTYALATARRRDVGDLTALRQLFDWVHAHGGDTLLTLPLLSMFPDIPSPYSPISRLFWNELHLTLDGLAPLTSSPPLIDYPTAFARMHAALRREVTDLSPGRRGAMENFLREYPTTIDYARFRAMRDVHGRDWRHWPNQFSGLDKTTVEMHEYAQWLLHEDLLELRAHVAAHDGLLGLDLPLGTHPDGFDAWQRRDLFASNVSVGAPPDMFFPSGQNWGFAPQLVHAAIATGHDYFIESVRNHLRHSSLLRIDHVMQFRRLYWVPDGFAPTDGTYVQYPFEHYLAILCLESHREGVAIVGENLGIVPAEVDEALASHRLLGTWVAYGAMDGTRYGRAFAGPEPWMLATLNTHDMPTFRGFVDGSDLDIRFQLGLIDGAQLATLRAERDDDVHATAAILRGDGWLADEGGPEPDALYRGMLHLVAASDAPVVLANLEDLWAENEQQNVPGTTVERPNWRRLTRRGVDTLDDDPAVGALFAHAHRVVSSPP